MVIKEVQLNTAKEKAQANLQLIKVQHTQIMENKDKELQILRDELQDAKAREVNLVVEYRRSTHFVHRLANRYNGGWSSAMRCANQALPDIEWEKV